MLSICLHPWKVLQMLSLGQDVCLLKTDGEEPAWEFCLGLKY